jgi:hypothetical protein
MFGLMRAKTCGMSADEKHFRRLNYCGTCKTIGSLYGQKSRLLLNNDTVFLAEILTVLSDENIQNWQKSYQSYNCLNLPKDKMPLSLQFAAATNIILAEFKIADHISDTQQRRFKFAHRIFSKEFLIAERLLNDWNFPLEKVRNLLQTQTEIENSANNLDEYSLPTATATAYFFSHGVKIIGKENLTNLAHEIGFAFGKLIYIIDAFEDFEQDEKANQFNALRSAFGEKKQAVSILLNLESEIITKIYDLPISETKKQIFASRLRENLQNKLQTELPNICYPKKRLTISERFKRAKFRATELTVNYSFAKALPVFVFVLLCAIVAPAQIREAKSARECAELSFNLMFLGSIFGTVLALPRIVFQQGYTPPDFQQTAEKIEKKRQQGWCDSWCNCGDCCSCAECCGDCDCNCCDGCGCDCCDCN